MLWYQYKQKQTKAFVLYWYQGQRGIGLVAVEIIIKYTVDNVELRIMLTVFIFETWNDTLISSGHKLL